MESYLTVSWLFTNIFNYLTFNYKEIFFTIFTHKKNIIHRGTVKNSSQMANSIPSLNSYADPLTLMVTRSFDQIRWHLNKLPRLQMLWFHGPQRHQYVTF